MANPGIIRGHRRVCGRFVASERSDNRTLAYQHCATVQACGGAHICGNYAAAPLPKPGCSVNMPPFKREQGRCVINHLSAASSPLPASLISAHMPYGDCV
jgi:hypothetical protein